MDVNAIISALSVAVARDSATAVWCTGTYEQAHTVYVNVDMDEPEDENACPYVAIYPVHKRVGLSVKPKSHIITVFCCIHDESKKDHGTDNIIEYEGVQRLESFRKLVETAIAGVTLPNLKLSTVDIDYSTIEFFPFMRCWMDCEFTERVPIGTDTLL